MVVFKTGRHSPAQLTSECVRAERGHCRNGAGGLAGIRRRDGPGAGDPAAGCLLPLTPGACSPPHPEIGLGGASLAILPCAVCVHVFAGSRGCLKAAVRNYQIRFECVSIVAALLTSGECGIPVLRRGFSHHTESGQP